MLRYYVVFLVTCLHVNLIHAKCPAFIKPCNHSDYHCLNNTISIAARELGEGIPDCDIPDFSSVKVSELKLDVKGIVRENIEFSDIQLKNVLQFYLKLLKWKDKVCTLDIEFPMMIAQGNIAINFPKLFGYTKRGTFTLRAENINCLLHLSGVREKKAKKDYIRLSYVEMKLTIPHSKMTFSSDSILDNMVVDSVLAYQEEKIYNAAMPIIEELASEYIKSLINKLTDDCTYRQLFLD